MSGYPHPAAAPGARTTRAWGTAHLYQSINLRRQS
jgi:hypothetical protein